MKIFLVGFMGCGKTTHGKALAREMNFSFLDLDDELIRASELSINELYATGADTFRKLERDILQGMSPLNNHIIATGGGTPCFYNNIDWMNRNGITVYLESTSAMLYERLKNDREHRPLLRHLPDNELHTHIAIKLEERCPFYKKATLTIKPDSGTTIQIQEELSRIAIL